MFLPWEFYLNCSILMMWVEELSNTFLTMFLPRRGEKRKEAKSIEKRI